jgi:hypothetical protein
MLPMARPSTTTGASSASCVSLTKLPGMADAITDRSARAAEAVCVCGVAPSDTRSPRCLLVRPPGVVVSASERARDTACPVALEVGLQQCRKAVGRLPGCTCWQTVSVIVALRRRPGRLGA